MFGQDSSEHDRISIFQPLNESSNKSDETYKNQEEVWKRKLTKLLKLLRNHFLDGVFTLDDEALTKRAIEQFLGLEGEDGS